MTSRYTISNVGWGGSANIALLAGTSYSVSGSKEVLLIKVIDKAFELQ